LELREAVDADLHDRRVCPPSAPADPEPSDDQFLACRAVTSTSVRGRWSVVLPPAAR
jgi:hypothetical protein